MRIPGAAGESRCWLRNSDPAEQFPVEGRPYYSGTEYVSWLGDAGFVDARVVAFDAPGANGTVVARRP